MHFSVSGVDVAPWVPPLVAFGISFFTSMGGVSGAFLLLPFQMSVLGFTTPAVSATNQLFNIVAIPSGVARYVREGRMVWPLAWVVIVGTLPGVLIGAVIRVRYLPDPQSFKVFAGLVLAYIGIRMVADLVRPKSAASATRSAEERFQQQVAEHRRASEERVTRGEEGIPRGPAGNPSRSENREEARDVAPEGRSRSPTTSRPSGAADCASFAICSRDGVSGRTSRVAVRSFRLTRISYEFYGEVFSVSTIGIFALTFVVGVVGGVYGIGGGAIVAPFFVSVFGLPVYTVAGAALMGTFVTSVAGVTFYQALAPFHPDMAVAPDWLLGLLFGIGGAAGMYCGARFQKHVPARVIKWILAGIITFVAVRYILPVLGLG